MSLINNYYNSTNYEPQILNKTIKDLKEGDIILNYVIADIVKLDSLQAESKNLRTIFSNSEYLTSSDKYLIHLNNIKTGELNFNDIVLRGDDSVSKLLNLNLDLDFY